MAKTRLPLLPMPRTSIAQMREVISVYTREDAPFGEYSLKSSLTLVAENIRARINNVSGSAFRNGIALDGNITHTVEIRNPRGEFELTTENVLVWKDLLLRIRQARPVGKTSIDPRKQFVLMMCEAEAESGAFKDPSPETE